MIVICSDCGKQQKLLPDTWRCSCGGAWEPIRRTDFVLEQIDRSDTSVWRYRRHFGLDFPNPGVRLGQGGTPLILTTIKERPVYLKLEHLSPTGSFKDRGTEVMMNILHHQGVAWVVDDSSGNAGASVAAYAAAAGIRADVFVPAYASKNKQAQIAVYGATVHPVPGERVRAKQAAIQAAEEGAVYASHAYHPGFLLGQQSLAWEIWEQLERRVPDWYIVPVGQGGHLLGVWLGFHRLLAARLINTLPRLVGVQSVKCAPVARAYDTGQDTVTEFKVADPSMAEGIMIAHPLRGRRVLQAIQETHGACLAVTEEAIADGQRQLAHQGIYVEPTSATVIAALDEVCRFAAPDDKIVVSLTGSGLKGSPTLK